MELPSSGPQDMEAEPEYSGKKDALTMSESKAGLGGWLSLIRVPTQEPSVRGQIQLRGVHKALSSILSTDKHGRAKSK